MRRMPLHTTQVIEVVHLMLLWITLYLVELVSGYVLGQLAYSLTWHYVAIALATLICVIFLGLGKKQFVHDIQEICIYDVVVQFFGLISYVPGTINLTYLALAQGIFVLKALRIIWPFIEYHRQTNLDWPLIGVLGLIRRRALKQRGQQPPPLRMGAMFMLVVVTTPIAISMAYVAKTTTNPVPVAAIFTLCFTVAITAKLIQFFEEREQEHLQTVRDLGAAMGREQERQKYIAELTAINTQLDQKNAELERAYQERAALSQKLAARNDRLADDAHDVNPGLTSLAQKPHISHIAVSVSV
jgi:hypothetical protein